MKSIHDGVEHIFEFCKYKATTRSNLQQRIKYIHDGVKHSSKYCDYKETRKSILQQHDGNKYIFELFQYKASQKDCLDIGDKSWKLIKTYRKLIKLIGKLLKLIGNILELRGAVKIKKSGM